MTDSSKTEKYIQEEKQMISEKVMVTPCKEIHPISEDTIKSLVDIAVDKAEEIDCKVATICNFLNTEEFNTYISSKERNMTEVYDLKTQVVRLVEVIEDSARLIEIIETNLGM